MQAFLLFLLWKKHPNRLLEKYGAHKQMKQVNKSFLSSKKSFLSSKKSFLSSKKSFLDEWIYCACDEDDCRSHYDITGYSTECTKVNSFADVPPNSNFIYLSWKTENLELSVPLNHDHQIYLFTSGSTITVKGSKLFAPTTDYEYFTVYYFFSSDDCNYLMESEINGLFIWNMYNEDGSKNTQNLVVESTSSSGYFIGFPETTSTLTINSQVTIDFKTPGSLQAAAPNAAQTSCNSLTLSSKKSSPTIKYQGSLSNYDSLGSFVSYAGDGGGDDDDDDGGDDDAVYCICKDDKLSECPSGFGCNKIAHSVSDIKESGGIFVKGNYEVDVSLKADIFVKAPNSKFTVKGSQTVQIFKEEEILSLGFVGKLWDKCSNVDEPEKFVRLSFDNDLYNVEAKSTEDKYSIIIPSQKTVSLSKTELLLNFKSKTTVYGITVNDHDECNDQIKLKDYKTEPTIEFKGKIANKDDIGDFMKKKSGLSGGAIAGIVIGCVVVVGAIVAVVIIFFLQQKSGDNKENAEV